MKLNTLKKVIFAGFILLLAAGSVAYGQKKHKKSGATHHQYKGSAHGSGIPVIRGIQAKLKKAALLQGYDSGAGLETFTLDLGLTTYYGDLCDRLSCMIFRPNFGIGYMYRWDRRVSFRAEANYYRLHSGDYYKQRDFSFRSGNFEFYVAGVYDIFEFSKRYKKRKTFTPYVFGGFGFTHFNPKAQYMGTWYTLHDLHTEGNSYARTTAIIPFGGGIRVKYQKGFDFMLEAGYRKAFSDRLDDVSSHQFQKLASFSDPAAQALSNKTALGDAYQGYRGNPHKKDGYFIFQLKVCYTPKLKLTSMPRYRHKVGTRTH